MLTPRNMLICVFSYNMGATLDRCLTSIAAMCPGFPVVLIDDQSEDPETRAAIERHRGNLQQVFHSTEVKNGKKHGNLYLNIQRMCAYALENGYQFLFMVQDDMQVVRPLSPEILDSYGRIFASDEMVLQVDPRFLRERRAYRRNKGMYEIDRELGAYFFPVGDYRRSYADVGILRLSTIRDLNWTFVEGETTIKKQFSERGYKRAFPFAPITMHVPFPRTYRNGVRKTSILLRNRGTYSFQEMTAEEQAAMDRRPIEALPFFRDFLRPKNMRLSRLLYWIRRDPSVFR